MREVWPELVQERDQLRAIRYGRLDQSFVPAERDRIEVSSQECLCPRVDGESDLFLFWGQYHLVANIDRYAYAFIFPESCKEVAEDVYHAGAPLPVLDNEGRTGRILDHAEQTNHSIQTACTHINHSCVYERIHSPNFPTAALFEQTLQE